MPDLYNRCDEFLEEIRQFKKRWILDLKEIDEKTLDMTTVVILIRHDHEMSIPKRLVIGIGLFVLQSEELLDILNLLVLHDLVD